MPSFNNARCSHGCGTFRNVGNKKVSTSVGKHVFSNNFVQVYVVAGGESGGTSTEILFEGKPNWVTVQPLPRSLNGPSSVSLANSVLLLGKLSQLSFLRLVLGGRH